MQSFKTVECLLVPSEWIPPGKKNPDPIAATSEDAEQFIWQLCIASTQLCKVLNDQIGQHPEFETWKENRSIPREKLKSLWNLARNSPPYAEMPERFNRSAWLRVKNIYAGWFKTQRKLLASLNGLNRWLSIVKSDQELVEISGCELEQIQARANELVSEIKSRLNEPQSTERGTNSRDKNRSRSATIQETSTDAQPSEHHVGNAADRSLTNELFATYFSLAETNTNLLDRCAIVHLLKNGCKIATKLEVPHKFTLACNKKHKKAQRIEKQLKARLPQVRDLGDEALKALSNGAQVVTLSNPEFSEQLANLQRKSNPIPYPVLFYSGDDLRWHLIKRKHPVTQKIEERIFVEFKGLNKCLREQLKKLGLKNDESRKEYIFEVCCDRRQHQIFQQFLNDWQTYSSSRDEYSVDSFLFVSAALIWRKSTRQDSSGYQLYLQCTFDYQGVTAEGDELARAEKSAKVSQKIATYEAKQQNGELLTNNQQRTLNRLQSQLSSLNNPLARPSKRSYKGNPNLVVGVSFSLENLATVAVVDGSTQQVIAYRSIRQLLGKDYKLLSAYRLKQGRNANERHKRQKQGKVSNLTEANKGKYIDRLIAKAIVEVVQEFKAGILALPQLTGLRESIQSRIEAKAELRHPGDRAKQEEYQKQHKINVHQWSYARLIQSLKDRASKVGVPIELEQPPSSGDFRDKAVQIALSAYVTRKGVAT